MWINSVFLVSLMCLGSTVFAVTNELRIEAPEEEAKPTFNSPFQFDATLDLQSKESRLDRPTPSRSGSVRELSLGVRYQVQKELGIYFEGASEEFDGESEFFVKEAYLDLDFRFAKWFLTGQVGQIFYPVGWLAQEDNYFLSNPAYYNELFKGDKALDLGAALQFYPWNNTLLSFEGHCFEGRVFRDSDALSEGAEQRPCGFGIRSQSKWVEAYYSHFVHNLAFYDAVRADGVGLKSETPSYDLKNISIKAGAWGEFWSINTTQVEGANSLTQAGFLYPYLDVWRFRAAYRWSPARTTISTAELGKIESQLQDDVLRFELRVLEPLKLIYEDQKIQQVDGITLTDEWSARVLFELKGIL